LTVSTLLIVVLGLFANTRAQKNAEGWGAMKYPQLVLGMLALFTYVGVGNNW
jgi:FHS family L-fucose permease-like MFS transporter